MLRIDAGNAIDLCGVHPFGLLPEFVGVGVGIGFLGCKTISIPIPIPIPTPKFAGFCCYFRDRDAETQR